MASDYKEELFAHQRSDELYIDEHHRRCPRCERNLDIFNFRATVDNASTQHLVTWLCQNCRYMQKSADALLAKSKAETSRNEAAKSLARVLKSATRRSLLEEAAPTPGGGLRRIIEKMGGEEAAWDSVGKAIKDALEDGDIPDRITASKTLISFSVQTAKLQGDPIDLSTFSDEDLFMLLMPVAKQMASTDEEFRKELLNDREIREMLLSDLGIETIETSAS